MRCLSVTPGHRTKTIARRVLKEIFPANDLDALREVVSDQFVNHEAPAGAGLVRCLFAAYRGPNTRRARFPRGGTGL